MDRMKPRKPVWWKIVIGLIVTFNSVVAVVNRKPPSPNVNIDQFQGMQAAQFILIFVGIWLIWSGTKPLRSKPTDLS